MERTVDQKCSIIGKYSYDSHTVVFTKIGYPPRTDDTFRAKQHASHHKADTPLLDLPIDMIKDFVVADPLHLLELGVMKRLIIGLANSVSNFLIPSTVAIALFSSSNVALSMTSTSAESCSMDGKKDMVLDDSPCRLRTVFIKVAVFENSDLTTSVIVCLTESKKDWLSIEMMN